MILFPNCKINIGLDILCGRPDGFHEIETVMYPVRGLCDALEMVRAGSGFEFTSSGLPVDCPAEKNICYKAYRLMATRFGIGGARMHLHKAVPFGAGLGGGSADGAYTIKGLSELFRLGLSVTETEALATEIGSDTAFFIRNSPRMARGRGEALSPIEVALTGKTLVIVKPHFGISTAEAYAGVKPQMPPLPLAERITLDISQWHEHIGNAFERHIFRSYPELNVIKSKLYALGAEYASMSGSGSAMYGIFAGAQPEIASSFPGMFLYQELMTQC